MANVRKHTPHMTHTRTPHAAHAQTLGTMHKYTTHSTQMSEQGAAASKARVRARGRRVAKGRHGTRRVRRLARTT